MEAPGSSLLHDKNPNLHTSQEIESTTAYLRAGGESIPNSPNEKIAAYLGFLADTNYVNDGIMTGDETSRDRQIEAASVALTPENAHAYVKFQAKVARELGRGAEIDPDALDKKTKMEALRLVRTDQQKQLKDWVDELNSKDNNYPGWFKYWMFNNVTHHTAFNDDLGKKGQPKGFERRSGSSFALFPELDRESISLVHDALTEKLGGNPMGFEYENMRGLLAKANFGELYGEAQNYGFKITDRLKEVTTGEWHDFTHSDRKVDAQALSSLVKSYRTGWCTAGSQTAHVQLSTGDFYVWCSTNPETGKAEVPRIAVRMEQGQVAEVRGIIGGRRQELEPQLADIVMQKIKDLPGGEIYFKKAEDMKRLTGLEKLITKDPETSLRREDIKFLYEIGSTIDSFGYDTDPRIQEIRDKRGNLDHGQLKELAIEHLRESFEASYEGYSTIATQLQKFEVSAGRRGILRRHRREATNSSLLNKAEVGKLFEAKLAEWQERGVLDYVAERIITHGELHTPVARPNVVVSVDTLKTLAHNFAKGQKGWDSAYIYDQLYDAYTTDDELAQLSGFNLSEGAVSFSLIPNKDTKELGYEKAEEQIKTLESLRKQSPHLKLKVPSVLDALTLWQTLRAGGDKLSDSSAFTKTYIRHFNLSPKRLGRWLDVPRSYVNGDGKPRLSGSNAELDARARLAVG